MKAPPGSARWLLRHELRLAWYGAAINAGGRRRMSWGSMTVWAVAWLLLHVAAFAFLRKLTPGGVIDPVLAIPATILLAAVATFMLAASLRASVLALFERGDLDLLLSSPLSSRSIFTVRLLGVILAAAALYLFLFGPLVHVGVALGQFHWVGVYVAIVATATLMACLGMLLTLALVRLLGARRTRVLAQVLSAVAGALLFLLSQSYSMLSHSGDAGDAERTLRTMAKSPWLGPDSPLWLPGRAVLGDPLPTLGMALLGIAAFALTVGRTHRFFVHGLQQAAGSARAAGKPSGPLRLRFRRSLFDTVVAKEWRLIARDPHLISQVLLQLVYLAPMLFLILRKNDAPGPAIGAGLALLCSSLTSSLAWIIVSAEDAPDLLHSSPAAGRTIRLAKLAASVMPPLLLVALPLLWLLVRAPLAGLLIAFVVVGAVLSAALIVGWLGRPGLRSDFKMRGKENFLCTVFEGVNTLCWGGLGWLVVSLAVESGASAGSTALMAAGVLAAELLCLLLAWLMRRRRV
ncbi:putative ABC transporter permease subunit [Massilia sp. LXY-6]|uniref:putative ABC transporter permease subunit n=1 Tax=Massilia sp. LXY-6 TaxID=3379823 RepID=UPI003EE2AB26